MTTNIHIEKNYRNQFMYILALTLIAAICDKKKDTKLVSSIQHATQIKL